MPRARRCLARFALTLIAAGFSGSPLLAETPPAFPGLLPKAKEYHEGAEPLVLTAPGETLGIHLAADAPVLDTAARDLIARIEALGGRADVNPEDASVHVFVKSAVGDPDSRLFPADLPEHEQGYALQVIKASNGKAQVGIAGTDELGAGYGVQSLIQLLARSDSGITVRRASIRDWPTFTFRSFKGQRWYYRDNRMFARWAPRFKWNVFAPCYSDCPDWREPPPAYRAMIADICTTANDTGAVRIMQLGNPFMLKEKAIRASVDDDIETLARFFELSLERGSDVLMLCLDDFAYLPDEDKQRFGSLAAANASVVTRFTERIRSRHPDTRLLVCPPPYWMPKDEKGFQYLRDFSAGIPEGVEIVWTGKEVTTVCHDEKDIRAYHDLIGDDRHLFLWDNTLKMPPGWGNVFRQNAFLVDCDDTAGSAWPDMATFANASAVINTYGPGEIYKVPLMTAADYLWNPEAYDPDDAMHRALYYFDENPAVGPMVHRWVNGLHQDLYDKRLAFLAEPTIHKLSEIRALTGAYQGLFDEISEATKNKTLIAAMKPYLDRHVDALPLLEEVQAAADIAPTDAYKAQRSIVDIALQFKVLPRQLARGDISEDRHGCVMTTLENETLQGLHDLRGRWRLEWLKQHKTRSEGDSQDE